MLATRPSRTALLIAKAQVLFAHDPRRRHLVPPLAAKLAETCLGAAVMATP